MKAVIVSFYKKAEPQRIEFEGSKTKLLEKINTTITMAGSELLNIQIVVKPS